MGRKDKLSIRLCKALIRFNNGLFCRMSGSMGAFVIDEEGYFVDRSFEDEDEDICVEPGKENNQTAVTAGLLPSTRYNIKINKNEVE